MDDAIDIDPKREEAYMLESDVYVELTEYDKALDVLEAGQEAIGEDNLSDEYVEKMEEVEELIATFENVEGETTEGADAIDTIVNTEKYDEFVEKVEEMDSMLLWSGVHWKEAIKTVDPDTPYEPEYLEYNEYKREPDVGMISREYIDYDQYVFSHLASNSIVFYIDDKTINHKEYYEAAESFGPWILKYNIFSVEDAKEYFCIDELANDANLETATGYKIINRDTFFSIEKGEYTYFFSTGTDNICSMCATYIDSEN